MDDSHTEKNDKLKIDIELERVKYEDKIREM